MTLRDCGSAAENFTVFRIIVDRPNMTEEVEDARRSAMEAIGRRRRYCFYGCGFLIPLVSMERHLWNCVVWWRLLESETAGRASIEAEFDRCFQFYDSPPCDGDDRFMEFLCLLAVPLSVEWMERLCRRNIVRQWHLTYPVRGPTVALNFMRARSRVLKRNVLTPRNDASL